MSKMYSCSGSTKFSSYPQNSQTNDGANHSHQSKRDLSSTNFKSPSVDISASNNINNLNNNNTNQQHKFLSSLVQDYLVNPVLSHLTNTATLLNDQVKVVPSSVDPTVGASPGSYPPSAAESDYRVYEQLYRMTKNIFGVAGLSFDCAHHQAPSGGRRNSSGFVGSLSEESKQLISDLYANASVAAAQAATSNLCATTSTDAHSNNFLGKVMMFLMPSIPFGSPSKESGSISTPASPRASRKGTMDSNSNGMLPKMVPSENSTSDTLAEFPSLKHKSLSAMSSLNRKAEVGETKSTSFDFHSYFQNLLSTGSIQPFKLGECKRTRSMSDVGCGTNNEVQNALSGQKQFYQDFRYQPHHRVNTTTVDSCGEESSQNQSEEEEESYEQSYPLVQQQEAQRPVVAGKKKIVQKLAAATTTTGGCSTLDLCRYLFSGGKSNTASSTNTTKTEATVPEQAKDLIQSELKDDNGTNGQAVPEIVEVLQQHRQLKQERRRKNRRRRNRKSKNKSSSDTESSKSSDTGSIHDESSDDLPHSSNNYKAKCGSRRSKRMKGPCMALDFDDDEDDDLLVFEFEDTKDRKKALKSPKSPKSPKFPRGVALFGHNDEDDEDADEEEEDGDDVFDEDDDDYDHMDGVDMSIFGGGGLLIGTIFGNSCSSASASTSVASNSPICDNSTTTTTNSATTSVCAGIPSTVRALFNGGLCPFTSRNSAAASSSVSTIAPSVSDSVDIPVAAFSPSTFEDDFHVSPLFNGGMSPDLSPMPLTEEDIQRNRQMMEEEEKNRILVEEANKRWEEAMLCEPEVARSVQDHPKHPELQQGEVFALEDVDQPDNQSSPLVKKSASDKKIGKSVSFSQQLEVVCPIDETEEEEELSKQSRQKYWEYLAMDRARHEAEISAVLKPEHRERIFRERFANPEAEQKL